MRRHRVVVVTHAPQRGADRVLAHASLAGQQGREHVAPVAGQWAQVNENFNGPGRKGHKVWPAVQLACLLALHVGGRDLPHAGVKVKAGPLHRPDVAGPLKQQRRQL